MIIVKNRELLIPANERYIGTPQDNLTDMREFRLDRIVQNGYDLSSLTFRIDLKYPAPRKVYTFTTSTSRSGRSVVVKTQIYTASYPNAGTKTFTFNGTKWNDGSQNLDLDEIGVAITYTPNTGDTITVVTTVAEVETDTALLTSEIQDDYVVLIWEITANQINVPGTVFVSIRGTDDSGDQRYASFPGVFYVEKNVYAPKDYAGNLSELEQLENNIIAALRKVDSLYRGYDDLEAAVEDAEAWATGTRNDVPVGPSEDSYHNNAKYWNQRAERYAVGKENGTPVSSGEGYQDNAKYYSEQADLIGEKWARGTADGTPVGSGDETYHNNAKYYSEQADAIGEKWARGTVDGVPVDSGDETYHNNAKYYAESVGAFSGEAESWARGSVNGVDVPSTNQTYHNNAKYYAEQADISGEKWARGTVDGADVSSGDETFQNNSRYYAQQAGATVSNLQTQLNQALNALTEDSEVQNARVDVPGTIHTTLKQRLDSDYNKNAPTGEPSGSSSVSITDALVGQRIQVVAELPYSPTAANKIITQSYTYGGAARSIGHALFSTDLANHFYGGTVNTITGKIISKYDASGNQLATSVEYDAEQYLNTFDDDAYELRAADASITIADASLYVTYIKDKRGAAAEADYTYRKLNELENAAVDVDASLFVHGRAADAGSVGDAIVGVRGIAAGFREALLACFQKVAWIDQNGQDYYDALHDTLFPAPVSIAAVFTQDDTVIWDTDSLDDLKRHLVVTATYGDSSTAQAFDYTLSGTLTAGTSTITVSYMDLSATFPVTVTHNPAYLTSVYTQTSTVYDGDPVSILKSDLVVTYYENAQSIGVVLSENSYTLSGTLTEGTRIVTVNYRGVTDTFSVTVAADPSYITAAFTQPQAPIYTDNAIDSLKNYLVVTLFRRPGESGTVLADSAYTLNGTLIEGTSVITAEYQGLTDNFEVSAQKNPAYILARLDATYDGDAIIKVGDNLDLLKNHLNVVAYFMDESSAVIQDYTLSGTLIVGNCTIQVTYMEESTSFVVKVYAERYVTTGDVGSMHGAEVAFNATGNPTFTTHSGAYFGLVFNDNVSVMETTVRAYAPRCRATLVFSTNENYQQLGVVDFGDLEGHTTFPAFMSKSDTVDGYSRPVQTQNITIDPTTDVWTQIIDQYIGERLYFRLTNGTIQIIRASTGQVIASVNNGANRIGFWGSYYVNSLVWTDIKVLY